jgi:hypothetical protein
MSGEEMTDFSVNELAREAEERALDLRVIAALERTPEVSVSPDFAARVALKVPARRSVAVTPSRWGRLTMWASLAVLLVAMVLVAGKGGGRTALGSAVEWTLCAQFLGLAVWLGVRRWTPR